ncbi:MAG TPA: peptide chain release factor N(5)-glutamine methyltransferase [Rhizomicrobium sp.]|nr:peptide chain release factor N(5)-glutamine methyltransferase [Rhizomicrobium sp.]
MSDEVAEATARLRAAGIDNPRLDARLLWEFAKRKKTSLAPHLGGEGRGEGAPEAEARTSPPPHPNPLPPSGGRGNDFIFETFDSLVSRRIAHEPLAYITGHKEFWSLDFAIGPGVLIPRPDTETLIETALTLHPDKTAPLSILDLGTGSGALLVAALHEYPNAIGVGIDRAPEALAWAARNVAAHDLEARATLIESGWLEEAAPGFDLVLCNPPYIPSADIATLEPEIARFEPLGALDGGPDGLDAYRALATRIGRLLRPGGHALLELGIGQADAVAALMGRNGLQTVRFTADLAGIPRCLVVRRNPATP